jgi:hypothetical protein
MEIGPVKVNIDFRGLRAAFNIAVNWNLIKENPFRKCKQLRIPPQRPEQGEKLTPQCTKQGGWSTSFVIIGLYDRHECVA